MGNKILTFVVEEAENVWDSVVAAAVNEIHNLGHKIKEVRVMGDTGEQKLALNTVEGVNPEAIGEAPATPPAEEPPAEPVEPEPVEPPAEPPVVETGGSGAPTDTPPEPPTADPTNSGTDTGSAPADTPPAS